MNLAKKLLWVDDDPEDRFAFEFQRLEERGWSVTWAHSITKAAEILSNGVFTAAILDQMLPVEGFPGQPETYGGCVLLHWLRERKLKSFDVNLSGPLQALKPHPENIKLSVIILSAYHDAAMLQKFREASTQDKELPFLAKPIDLASLIDNLNKIIY